MLRAGPFSDERVVRLANRRFVSFYFDLSNQGVAGDPDARKFVVAKAPELGGSSVPTPDVLFMTPAGKIVGRVSNYASEDEVLKAMQRVLRENPSFARPTAEERALQGLERATCLIDVGDPKGATRVLKKLRTPRAFYLLGRLARRRADWKAMERWLRLAKDPELDDDKRVERAWRLWHEGAFKELAEALKEFARDSSRYTEARYLEGLALYQLGRQKQALAVWKQTIKGCNQDPWIYRADWAYTGALQSDRSSFSSAGRRTSLLNRIGYMGRKNPDLTHPRGGRRRL